MDQDPSRGIPNACPRFRKAQNRQKVLFPLYLEEHAWLLSQDNKYEKLICGQRKKTFGWVYRSSWIPPSGPFYLPQAVPSLVLYSSSLWDMVPGDNA